MDLDTDKFVRGTIAGTIIFAIGMFNIWAWDIMNVDQMTKFNADHFWAVPIIAAAVIGGTGFLYGVLGKKKY